MDRGRDAAYRIISWDDATIEITPIADGIHDNIQQPLMHVMMESLKIKDENQHISKHADHGAPGFFTGSPTRIGT